MKKNAPIGIFDSGIGGLTVAHAIQSLLPKEQIIYFGDTAHLPYGDKSKESISNYSLRITEFLIAQGCKMVVIACNTASSFGFKDVKEKFGNQVEVVNVIDPVVEELAKSSHKKIGVIGTKGTIGSRVYPKKINKKMPEVEVGSVSTPLLCPMIEEGYFNNNISTTIIHDYLSRKPLLDIEAIILACTHYPLIRNEVASYYKTPIRILDCADVTAKRVKSILEKKDALSEKLLGEHKFYVSDLTDSFEKSTKIFFKQSVHLQLEHLWRD